MTLPLFLSLLLLVKQSIQMKAEMIVTYWIFISGLEAIKEENSKRLRRRLISFYMRHNTLHRCLNCPLSAKWKKSNFVGSPNVPSLSLRLSLSCTHTHSETHAQTLYTSRQQLLGSSCRLERGTADAHMHARTSGHNERLPNQLLRMSAFVKGNLWWGFGLSERIGVFLVTSVSSLKSSVQVKENLQDRR